MDPVSLSAMAVGSMISSAAGAAMSYIGAGQTADSMSAMATYKSQIAANNRVIAERNATYAELSGVNRAFYNDLKYRDLIGKQKAAQAAKGVDVNTGSPVDVRASTAEIGRLDTLTIQDEAERKAYGYRVQGANFDAESQLDLMEADNAQREGKLKQISSLIGGASSISDKWIGYKTKGVFN